MLFNLEFEDFDNSLFKKTYSSKYRQNIISAKFNKSDLLKFLDKTRIVCEAPILGLFTLGLMKLFKKLKITKLKLY